jgi:hypothetical protein
MGSGSDNPVFPARESKNTAYAAIATAAVSGLIICFLAIRGCGGEVLDDTTTNIEPGGVYGCPLQAEGKIDYTLEVRALNCPVLAAVVSVPRSKAFDMSENRLKSYFSRAQKIPAGETQTITGTAETGCYYYFVHNPDKKKTATVHVKLSYD